MVTSPEIWTSGVARVGDCLIMGELGDLPTPLPQLTVPLGVVCQIKGAPGGHLTTLHLLQGETLKTLHTATHLLITRTKAREETIFLEISTPSNLRHYIRGKDV